MASDIIKDIETSYLENHLLPQNKRFLAKCEANAEHTRKLIARIEAELKLREETGYEPPEPWL